MTVKFLYATSNENDIDTINLDNVGDMYVEGTPEGAKEQSSAEDTEIVLEYTLTRVLRVRSKPVVEVVTDYTKPKTKGAKK
jgi:hypothetical protein